MKNQKELSKWAMRVLGTIIGGLLVYSASWGLDQVRSKSKDIRVMQKEIAVLQAQRQETKDTLARFNEASKQIFTILQSNREDKIEMLIDIRVLKKMQDKILRGSKVLPKKVSKEDFSMTTFSLSMPKTKPRIPKHSKNEDEAMRLLQNINTKGIINANREAIDQSK